jgi:hypothetical protein
VSISPDAVDVLAVKIVPAKAKKQHLRKGAARLARSTFESYRWKATGKRAAAQAAGQGLSMRPGQSGYEGRLSG